MTEELSDELVAYYRQVLITHGSIFGASNCPICGVSRCLDWVDAYDRLAAAGKPMIDEPVWRPYTPRPRP